MRRPGGTATPVRDGGAGPSGPTDPRCDAPCAPDIPTVDGAYSVCSAASVAYCKASCTTQLEGLSNLCQTCLIEEMGGSRSVSRPPPPCEEPDASCAGGTSCRMIGPGGLECTYCDGDTAARENCERTLYPRREIVCRSGVADVENCESICENDKAVPTPAGATDARCEDECRSPQPSIEGSGTVCSEASRQSCLTQCKARIMGVSNLCATCLLDGMHFGGAQSPQQGALCESDTTCTTGTRCELTNGPGASCDYCSDDRTGYESCVRTLDPRTERECPTDFDRVTVCADICTTQ